MTHYFLIETTGDDYQLCEADMPDQKNGLSWDSFYDGARIPGAEVEEPIIVDLDYPEDVMPEFFATPLLLRDDLLQDMLEFGIDNIDTYDCHLVDAKSGKIWTEYKLCNIIGLIDVFDMNASELHEDSPPDDALLFNEIVIDEKKAAGHHIFRPHGRMSEIMVSEALKQHLESKGKYPHMEFVLPENFG